MGLARPLLEHQRPTNTRGILPVVEEAELALSSSHTACGGGFCLPRARRLMGTATPTATTTAATTATTTATTTSPELPPPRTLVRAGGNCRFARGPWWWPCPETPVLPATTSLPDSRCGKACDFESSVCPEGGVPCGLYTIFYPQYMCCGILPFLPKLIPNLS